MVNRTIYFQSNIVELIEDFAEKHEISFNCAVNKMIKLASSIDEEDNERNDNV